jgi:SAM-dependent methyltransferase
VNPEPELEKALDIEKTNTLTLSLLEEAPAYNDWIFRKIKPFLGKDILEVGCGIGNLTGLLLSQGRVMAADVNEGYLRIVESKFRSHVHLQDLFLWDIQKASPQKLNTVIDTIVCSNVLEHVEEDDPVLQNFYRLLPAGGNLIVLVPAFQGLYNVLDRELGHFRRYGKKELRQKLIQNGFEVRRINFFNPLGVMGWYVNGSLLRRRLLPVWQVKVFDKIVPFYIWMEKIIPPLWGQSLIAVGEKG